MVVIVAGKVDTFKVEQLMTEEDTVPVVRILQKLPVETWKGTNELTPLGDTSKRATLPFPS